MKRFLSISLIIVLVFFLGAISATMFKDIYAKNSKVEINTIQATSHYTPEVSFSELAAKVTPAVVHISAEIVVKSQPFLPFNDPFFREFFKDMPEVENKNTSLGSGFIFNKDGYIVTNNHVIRDAQNITVVLQDGREFKGDDVEIVGTDERTDIAVLKIKTKDDLPYIPFGDSDKLQVGDWVMAVGNPFGFDGTVTVGVVSAKNRSNLSMRGAPVYQDFIQTDASINPGNSGGPLVDVNGSVIGVNAAIASPSGGNVGIGFAIPSNMVVMVVEQLMDKGVVSRAYLGIYPQELTPELKEKFGLGKSQKGILVAQVEKDTPAEKCGLKDGDIIIKFNNKKIENVSQFRIIVAESPINKDIDLVIIRNGKEKTLTVKLKELEQQTAQKEEKSEKWLGITVESLTAQNKEQYKLSATNGVVITNIDRKSPVLNVGIRIGDVITKIENMPIKNIKDYNSAKKKFSKKDDILLTIKRGNINIWLVVKNKQD